MTVLEITAVLTASCVIIGSIVSLIYTITSRPTYKYCDDTFKRKDLHSQEYEVLIEKIAELKEAIDHLQGN